MLCILQYTLISLYIDTTVTSQLRQLRNTVERELAYSKRQKIAEKVIDTHAPTHTHITNTPTNTHSTSTPTNTPNTQTHQCISVNSTTNTHTIDTHTIDTHDIPTNTSNHTVISNDATRMNGHQINGHRSSSTIKVTSVSRPLQNITTHVEVDKDLLIARGVLCVSFLVVCVSIVWYYVSDN